MENQILLLNMIDRPAFCAHENRIVCINQAARQMLMEEGAPSGTHSG